jgi:hypothetical protein
MKDTKVQENGKVRKIIFLSLDAKRKHAPRGRRHLFVGKND